MTSFGRNGGYASGNGSGDMAAQTWFRAEEAEMMNDPIITAAEAAWRYEATTDGVQLVRLLVRRLRDVLGRSRLRAYDDQSARSAEDGQRTGAMPSQERVANAAG